MKLITLYLPVPYLRALDSLVAAKYYPNRSEAIRVAVRDMLTVEAWHPERDLMPASRLSEKTEEKKNAKV